MKPDALEEVGLTRPDHVLFPSRHERRAVEDELTKLLIEALEDLPRQSVVPMFDREAFRADLQLFDFTEPRPLTTLLSWTVQQMQHGLVHVTHPCYFGLFNPKPSYPAECADRIAAAFNPQLATMTSSPAGVEIEAHVIKAVGQRAGFGDEVAGHFTSGGSEANFTALLCALSRCQPDFAAIGARAFAGKPVFYVSRECHLAWVKIGHQAGIGRQAVRFVETDGRGCLDPRNLADLIEADLASGHRPVMIVATAGTTNAGMIDPLSACAVLASKYNLWFHVDAAWGGALIASEQRRHLLEEMKRADSVTIDAHKWLSTTMGCGMFITPHAAILSATFGVTAGFMPSNHAGSDPFMASAQWSRRFLGLRLFLTLGAIGWSGYGRLVDSAILLSSHLRDGLVTRGWTIANDSSAAVVCAEPPGGGRSVREIVDHVIASGRAWCSVAAFEGREVLRACISNGASRTQDVDRLLDELDTASN